MLLNPKCATKLKANSKREQLLNYSRIFVQQATKIKCRICLNMLEDNDYEYGNLGGTTPLQNRLVPVCRSLFFYQSPILIGVWQGLQLRMDTKKTRVFYNVIGLCAHNRLTTLKDSIANMRATLGGPASPTNAPPPPAVGVAHPWQMGSTSSGWGLHRLGWLGAGWTPWCGSHMIQSRSSMCQ